MGPHRVLICYDLEFPEWFGALARAGVEVICAPTNWPDPGRPAGERPLETATVLVNSAINRTYTVAVDRVGRERDTPWVGGSVIAGPDGYPLATADFTDSEQLLIADIDPTTARDKRVGSANDRFADRRPELYG